MTDPAVLYLQEIDAHCDCLAFILSSQNDLTGPITNQELLQYVNQQKEAVKRAMDQLKYSQAKSLAMSKKEKEDLEDREREIASLSVQLSEQSKEKEEPLSPRERFSNFLTSNGNLMVKLLQEKEETRRLREDNERLAEANALLESIVDGQESVHLTEVQQHLATQGELAASVAEMRRDAKTLMQDLKRAHERKKKQDEKLRVAQLRYELLEGKYEALLGEIGRDSGRKHRKKKEKSDPVSSSDEEERELAKKSISLGQKLEDDANDTKDGAIVELSTTADNANGQTVKNNENGTS